MSLIKCKECNNEISDSADSCPKCGAPVPKPPGADGGQCGHCLTIVKKGATTCPNCGAKKGYRSGQTITNKKSLVIFKIIAALSIIIVFLLPAVFYAGGIIAIVASIISIAFLYDIIVQASGLMKGERWWL